MCGIAGAVGVPRIPVETRHEVLERLRPRGPDSSGELAPQALGEGIWLGIRRLAVIDVEGGDQPIANEDGSIAVVCNGEIYNHIELRRQLEARGHRFTTRSDTEVLVHLYEDRGDELSCELRGMFAFALWDRRRRRLLLARDRFGQKPLYWARTPSRGADGGLVFASEVKALLPLLRATGVSPTLSEQGIYDVLSLAAVPQPATIWREIQALEPAATLTFDDGTVRKHRYWSLEESATSRPPYRGAAAQIREEVAEAVRLRLRSDVPLGVFLSGGLDSSVVTWEAAKQTGPGLHTFTVSVDDPNLDEAPQARNFARRLGVKNTVLPLRVTPREELERLVEVFDQPFADPSALPSLAVARLARRHVTVVLNGDGGDEIFAGYRRYLAAHYGERPGRLLGWLTRPLRSVLPLVDRRRRSASGFLHRFLRGLDLEPGGRYLTWTTDMWREEDKRALWKGGPVRATESWIETRLPARGSLLARQMAGDRAINLLSDLLVKMDLATMASSLEARSPLLDHVVAERVAGLPESHLIRRGRLKAVLREAYRDVLPRSVLQAPKRGFEIPLEAWLAGDLAEVVGDTVGSPGARIHDWIDHRAVKRLLAGETFRDRNRAYLVYTLLVLELWLRRWA